MQLMRVYYHLDNALELTHIPGSPPPDGFSTWDHKPNALPFVNTNRVSSDLGH